MTTVITARDLITTALRRNNILQEGDVADANQAKDGLDRLNEEIDKCNSYPLGMMWSTNIQSIALDGSASYTLGPTGSSFGGTRPIGNQILGAWYTDVNAVDRPLQILDDYSYGSITYKSITGDRPFGVYINGTFPNATIQLHPTGATSGTLKIQYRGPLPPFTLNSVINLPPSYRAFLTWQLAVVLAMEYNGIATPDMVTFAENARQDIIKNNSAVPDVDLGFRRRQWDINSDSFRSY